MVCRRSAHANVHAKPDNDCSPHNTYGATHIGFGDAIDDQAAGCGQAPSGAGQLQDMLAGRQVSCCGGWSTTL